MPRSIIIDTDPGVDDVLAILLALASPEVSVRLISIVFGNTHAPVAHANLLKIYHLLAREIAAIPEAAARFGGLSVGSGSKPSQENGNGGAPSSKTILAMGGDGPVGGEKAVAAYFHGLDGLSNISQTHPHFTPPPLDPTIPHEHLHLDARPAWEVMLDVLREEEAGSIVIVALGPLTNLAHAIRLDPSAFARCAGVVWMGGALEHPGNTSPSAEFNCFADPYAADEVLAACMAGLFELVMAPLDITTEHQVGFEDLIHPAVVAEAGRVGAGRVEAAVLQADAGTSKVKATFNGTTSESHNSDKVLAELNDEAREEGLPAPTPLQAFIGAMLLRVRGLQKAFGNPDAMEMHDPVAIWYALAHAGAAGVGLPPKLSLNATSTPTTTPGWSVRQREFKVERKGELTRGMCVVDRRGTGESSVNRTKDQRLVAEVVDGEAGANGGGAVPSLLPGAPKSEPGGKDDAGTETGPGVPAKHLPWVITRTPGSEVLRGILLGRVFGTKVQAQGQTGASQR